MRTAALALVVLAGTACRRAALQSDAGGPGSITPDGTGGKIGSDGGTAGAAADGAPPRVDAILPTADANCGVVTYTSRYLAPQILVLLDQSVSDRSRWNQLLMSLRGVMADNGPRVDWGLYAFPEPGPTCGAETVTATIDLPITAMNYEAVIAAVGSTRLNGNGSPTAAAIATGVAYLRAFSVDNPKFLMLVTDGAPTCAGTIGALSDDPAQAQADAVAAITAARDEGLPTLVVAPAMTADSEIDALDALAVAGGYGDARRRPGFITESELGSLFLREGPNCTFGLRDPPPVPDAVVVTLDGAEVPRDTSRLNGWDYTDATHTSITFNGGWCDRVGQTLQSEVRVTYGCPAI